MIWRQEYNTFMQVQVENWNKFIRFTAPFFFIYTLIFYSFSFIKKKRKHTFSQEKQAWRQAASDLSLCFWPFIRKRHGRAIDRQPPPSQNLFQQQADQYEKSNMEGCCGEIAAYHPLCSHAQQERTTGRDGKRRSRGFFMMDCSRARGLGWSVDPELSGPANGHLSSGVWGSWGYPQRHGEVKWVTKFEVRPAVIAPNIQQMSGISIR